MAAKTTLLNTSAKIQWQKREEPKMVQNTSGQLISIHFIVVHNTRRPDRIVCGISLALAQRIYDMQFLLLNYQNNLLWKKRNTGKSDI